MYFVVLGPRRSGTNYLSELILCNTYSDSNKIANLDSQENSRNLNNRIYLNELNSDGIGTERYDPNEDNYSYNLELKDKKTTKMACLGGKTFIEINLCLN